MKRREFVQLGMATGALGAVGAADAAAASGASRRGAGVDLAEAGAAELAAAMAAGTLTSAELVRGCQAFMRR